MAPLDNPSAGLDGLFREAVAAIDAGNLHALERLLAEQPALVRERLETPGTWLRDTVGDALDGFFQRPYLLWFVAEDPVRTGTLPGNIAQVARAIILAAQRARAQSLQEQLDYGLRLVAWSPVARTRGVQLDLIDVLVDAGAALEGHADDALVNGNVAAAEHLLARGAPVTLATALCLSRWDDVTRLAPVASAAERQFGFVLAALNGHADALRRMIGLGIDLNSPSADLHAHGTPLHHAVSSGSLETVRVLVDAGANLHAKDTAWHGTPLGWAEYCEHEHEHEHDGRGAAFTGIVAYLRERGAPQD